MNLNELRARIENKTAKLVLYTETGKEYLPE